MTNDSSVHNPYALRSEDIAEPPTSLFGSLKHLGPGFILSASIVGSGELISTTVLGAKAGFVTLWVVIVSCLVKVALQLEFGKHAIYSGETTMEAFDKLPGAKIGRAHWSIWVWLGLMIPKQLQLAGIVGGVTQIMIIIAPIASEVPAGFATFFQNEPDLFNQAVWAVPLAISVALLVFRGYYKLLEKLSLVMIALFSVLTLVCVVMLQWTDEYAVTWGQVASGFTFELPKYALAAALGAFGITGVGGDEIMMYNYWLLEKGYAAKTGPRDDSEAWVRRAKGWIRVMYVDAFASMIVYTVVTAAFYLLGCAVLNRLDTVPEGYAMIRTLSSMYTETLGPWASGVFLAGAFIVLYSTLFSALAGWSRIFSDAFARIGMFDFENPTSRGRSIAILAWSFPTLWMILALFTSDPAWNVIVGGISTSVILLLVLAAALYFRYRRLPQQLTPSRLYDFALWISAVAILAVGAYWMYKGVHDYRERSEPRPAAATSLTEPGGRAEATPR
jgi:Mn2+/Fe2+ NRAMP family transporter